MLGRLAGRGTNSGKLPQVSLLSQVVERLSVDANRSANFKKVRTSKRLRSRHGQQHLKRRSRCIHTSGARPEGHGRSRDH